MLRNLLHDLHDLEQTCKEYFLKSDTGMTAITLGIIAILNPPMNYLDYRYYGWSGDYLMTSVFEVVFGAISVLLITKTDSCFVQTGMKVRL